MLYTRQESAPSGGSAFLTPCHRDIGCALDGQARPIFTKFACTRQRASFCFSSHRLTPPRVCYCNLPFSPHLSFLFESRGHVTSVHSPCPLCTSSLYEHMASPPPRDGCSGCSSDPTLHALAPSSQGCAGTFCPSGVTGSAPHTHNLSGGFVKPFPQAVGLICTPAGPGGVGVLGQP